MAYRSMCSCAYMLLFLVLAVFSDRFQILRSYTILLKPPVLMRSCWTYSSSRGWNWNDDSSASVHWRISRIVVIQKSICRNMPVVWYWKNSHFVVRAKNVSVNIRPQFVDFYFLIRCFPCTQCGWVGITIMYLSVASGYFSWKNFRRPENTLGPPDSVLTTSNPFSSFVKWTFRFYSEWWCCTT